MRNVPGFFFYFFFPPPSDGCWAGAEPGKGPGCCCSGGSPSRRAFAETNKGQTAPRRPVAARLWVQTAPLPVCQRTAVELRSWYRLPRPLPHPVPGRHAPASLRPRRGETTSTDFISLQSLRTSALWRRARAAHDAKGTGDGTHTAALDPSTPVGGQCPAEREDFGGHRLIPGPHAASEALSGGCSRPACPPR